MVVIPVKTVSESNAHEHWRARQQRAKRQRHAAAWLVRSVCSLAWVARHVDGGIVVHLTRVSPGTLDSDNLAASGKHVRDGIADALGIDDRDPRVTWLYDQRRGPRGHYAVEVRITPAASGSSVGREDADCRAGNGPRTRQGPKNGY